MRIEAEDLSITIQDIISTLSDVSWLAQFDENYMKMSFGTRAKETADYLAKKLREEHASGVINNTGEYVVSELAREAIVEQLHYRDIPLAELFKKQVAQNPGFDFYSANKQDIIIFGEAKFKTDKNAYGDAMKQVDEFIQKKKDITDIADIKDFFDKAMLVNAANGEKAYAIAFSSTKIKSERIIKNILNNEHYKELVKHKELIFVAVNI